MAGRGRRFKGVETLPKPLISFNGKTMIEWAIDTLGVEGQYIFIVLKDHVEKYRIDELLTSRYPTSKIVVADGVTEGPACTALLARKLIDNDDRLIITNCDQIMTWDAGDFMNFISNSEMHGCVVTYYSETEKNSYARIDEIGNVVEFAEKRVISRYSLNGIHFWEKGRYFVSSADDMIEADERVNNEFYIAPTYNFMIKKGQVVRIYDIDPELHHAIGTPEDLEAFLTEEQT